MVQNCGAFVTLAPSLPFRTKPSWLLTATSTPGTANTSWNMGKCDKAHTMTVVNLELFRFLFYIKLYSYFKDFNRMVTFQVPHSAVPLRETAVALACSAFSRSIHHWRGVLQKDHRKRAHHTTAVRHVQIQWYMSYWETEKKQNVSLTLAFTWTPWMTPDPLMWFFTHLFGE